MFLFFLTIKWSSKHDFARKSHASAHAAYGAVHVEYQKNYSYVRRMGVQEYFTWRVIDRARDVNFKNFSWNFLKIFDDHKEKF